MIMMMMMMINSTEAIAIAVLVCIQIRFNSFSDGFTNKQFAKKKKLITVTVILEYFQPYYYAQKNKLGFT